MVSVSTFYFSRVIGKRVYSPSGGQVGILKDFIVDDDFVRPKVVAARLNTAKGTLTVDFSRFKIAKEKGQYILEANELINFDPEGRTIYCLAKNILDRQIIDMDGRKLVRVNDLRLANLIDGTYLVAADVGFEGFMRRLGVAKPVNKVLKILGTNLPSHLILWDDVETVDFGHAGIKLSKDYSNLEKLHPSDLADIVEDMDINAQISLISSIDEEKAADILEELEPDVQRSVVENLPVDKAADILEKMPADEAADILEDLGDEEAEELLNEMEDEASDDIRELLEYSGDTAGSIMTTDFISFRKSATVDETIRELRKLKPESDTIYYLYVVDEAGRLTATVSLRDIIVSDPETPLSAIMDTNILYVMVEDELESLNEIIAKYSLLAVPVVDPEMKMLGVVIIDDVIHNLVHSRRKRA